MKELWKIINNYPDYKISNLGNVVSLKSKKEKLLNPVVLKIGYKRVILRHNKKSKQLYVHRLVAEHFLKREKNHECVNHRDGNKLNNNVNNLEWCTRSENNKHAWDNDLNSKEKRCKLKRNDVDKVRGLSALGLNGMQISKALNLPKTPIYWIIQGKTWGWYKLTK